MASSPLREGLKSRLRTARAVVVLTQAHITVGLIPFDRWRRGLGGTVDHVVSDRSRHELLEAHKLAAHIERAAQLVPFDARCLSRAVALSWQLRRRSIPHEVVLAVRPAAARETGDNLHARGDIGGSRVLGDLPGPWLEALRLGA